eukprot:CAMPEP_0206453120 /NCGR_PEP_ID=MMETSP0324_2-20121206/20348_1 /ASSEMBLY_ACC=CAM_ASM_000836 /TAXON_ID=2866 /ORGANISM="Crypthecodinium cohnii, Strain Seligo" /LENGTH=754 /DNA_ID=CAMNT_0053923333 /DNA_START=160 /DNA_END=2422 /DNA_ORIENTATION=-
MSNVAVEQRSGGAVPVPSPSAPGKRMALCEESASLRNSFLPPDRGPLDGHEQSSSTYSGSNSSGSKANSVSTVTSNCNAVGHHAPCIFPLLDLPRDGLLTSLEFLSALDLSRIAAASRIMLVIAYESATAISHSGGGEPERVISGLAAKLGGTPTMGFLFAADLRVKQLPSLLAKHLPPGVDIIGAATTGAQAMAGTDSSLSAVLPGLAPRRTDLALADEEGRISLQLGSFPDAEARAFHIDSRACIRLATAPSEAAGLRVLQDLGYPVGPEWRTIVLITSCNTPTPPVKVVKAFQRGSAETAVIGGVADETLLLHTRGRTRIMESGIVGLAIRGNVPLTALVSRGCTPLTPVYKCRGARPLRAQQNRPEGADSTNGPNADADDDDDDDDDEEDESEASGDGLLPDGDGPLPYPSSDEESEMGDGQGSESENSEAAFARQFEGGDSNVEAAVNNLDQPGRDDDNNQNDNNESEDLTEYLLIPELTDEAGNVVRPLAAVAEAQRASEQRFGNTLLFVGMRPRNRGGFLLEPVSRGSFQRGGTLLLGASSCGVEALTSQGLDMDDFEVRFYCLDPEACRQDLHRQLNFIKAECANLDERPLGSLMFTCAGRAEEFFGQNYADLRMFQEEFDLPTMGFWAGGEIGPQAMAEAIPEEATRSGRAMFQGFTAVFGIFRAPLPVRKGALETLGEHQLPQAVGEVLANWAREARRRGDAGRRDGDSKTVCARQWSRAAALASVETAMAILPPTFLQEVLLP